ncbi:MAG TPA: SRPBCC family protein [Arenimonas sp.]|uniref:SRPBCC family protein n=1 Tax=Arenimonas sp. TaxID=1872635 RepID=UPI002C6BBFEA|nr:SRPBCC family protein [Arenimonas sp.]HMB57535.1 SRPBCC family protein [Arenimonas sp.]
MIQSILPPPDPDLDLEFERVVDVPRERIWAAWTTPALLTVWFTPAPWRTMEAEVDLRPGGIFRTLMRSPEGQDFPNLGCYLEVIENEKLVWTNVFTPGFRPSAALSADATAGFAFTAVISLQAQGSGTRYRARVIHGNQADRAKHAAMGFEQGWGRALDQMLAMIKA